MGSIVSRSRSRSRSLDAVKRNRDLQAPIILDSTALHRGYSQVPVAVNFIA